MARRGRGFPVHILLLAATAGGCLTPRAKEPSAGVAPAAPSNPAAVQLTAATEETAPRPESASVVLQANLAQPPELLPPIDESPPAAPAASPQVYPIDFSSALAIAAGENPQVAYSRQRINEAFAQMRAAEILWVPSLRGGMNYNKHEGAIQDVAGNFINTSRGSLYSGLGAAAVGASSPAIPG